MDNESKKVKIMELLSQVYEPLLEYLDVDSDNMLDEKIKILTDIKNGKSIQDIPNFYDILELYPKEMWD